MPTLIEDYRRHAQEYGVNILGDDSAVTNESFDRLVDTARRLVRSGDAELFLSLFEDRDPWVQLCAATHALEGNESSAVAKLEQIAGAGIQLASMMAEETLEAWRKGELSRIEDA